MSDLVYGLNAVLEALESGKRTIGRLMVVSGRDDARLRQVLERARAAGVPVARAPRQALDRLADGGTHQGVIAFTAGTEYADAEEILASAPSPALFVVLDGVEDPRNLGAIVRVAAAAGAHGLFLPERGAAGMTAVAVKTSAGASERLPVARIGNVVSFLKSLKERNIWVVGLDSAGGATWTSFDLTAPVALVIGGEGKGLRRLARETCDTVLSIPMAAGVESLNMSVAAGVALFEVVRQRRPKGGASGG